ncbi:RibD family protein [Ornithinibacillus californiensis]|uniref:RibD family protein n=1 Tax=Ornithinibacillus californiensis TaxID=161536 RepID=UPI00069FF231|nr:RibD family protein [Ornithinibacillus californiensis]
MNRPTVILNIFSSVDGKTTTARGRNVTEWTAAEIDGEAHELTNRLYDELDCDGLISGSETLMVFGDHWVELDKPLYEPQKSRAYIVFDGRGRINWYQTEGLLVVTKENISKEYLEQLEDKGISYIQAGSGEHINLALALEKLFDMGFRKLGLSGGAGINGAFLRQGLIDEISLTLAPLAIGGSDTPSIFDGEEIKRLEDVVKLELLDVKKTEGGSVWLHYLVKE